MDEYLDQLINDIRLGMEMPLKGLRGLPYYLIVDLEIELEAITFAERCGLYHEQFPPSYMLTSDQLFKLYVFFSNETYEKCGFPNFPIWLSYKRRYELYCRRFFDKHFDWPKGKDWARYFEYCHFKMGDLIDVPDYCGIENLENFNILLTTNDLYFLASTTEEN